MADPLAAALVQIADDALRGNQDFVKGLHAAGSPIQYEPGVQTEADRKSLGAFVVANAWHHKLLNRTPGWMVHETHDFIGVSLSTALAILASERLHNESLAGDLHLQDLINKSIANLFRGFVVIYPEAKVREVSDAAFKLKNSLRSSSEPKAVEVRETLSQLVIVDALNRISRKFPEDKIDMVLFGLYDGLRSAIEPV